MTACLQPERFTDLPPELSTAVPAPTRRSNRLRTASAGEAVTAPQDVVLPAVDTSTAAVQAGTPSRRARREAAVAAAVVATVAAAIDTPDAAPIEQTAPVETAPVVEAAPVAEPVMASASEAPSAPQVPTPGPGESAADAFAAAASAFGIAADSAAHSTTRRSPRAASAKKSEDVAPVASVAPDRARRRLAVPRKILAGSATVGVMGLAGMIAVSMTLPSTAIAASQNPDAQASMSLVSSDALGTDAPLADDEIQAYVASSDVQSEEPVRTEDFSTISLSDLAAEEGIAYSNSVFTNNADAAIQWPFVVGVAMSSTYGMRNGRMHEGIDLVPGAGAPIQSIADGTVRIATEAGGNYGVTVYIDHVIDGQVVTSHYSHMQYGSLRVKAGDTVKVGDIVGKVGNTGRSYGAHLHFELIVNGAKIDPLPWLQKNTGRMSY